ncbi:Uncharacterized protein TCM_030048 [Theobroma cacao]|uniref:Uncharacterized protein n=1 Tax=Theobroma cacao TaxID=3641 RepID=A0A061GG18_THECC|nr:Uncharacterized protein TCM_030048 [Theobroma cacao]
MTWYELPILDRLKVGYDFPFSTAYNINYKSILPSEKPQKCRFGKEKMSWLIRGKRYKVATAKGDGERGWCSL